VYFDAVLDENRMPVFNGTPDETREFLRTNENNDGLRVCAGRTLKIMSVEDYLAQ
jgi:hypothetical protein